MTKLRLNHLHLMTLATTLALATLASPDAQAQYTDLHDFDTPSLASPQFPGILSQGRDGNIYGTAPLGGASGRGGVFQITPAGAYSLIYNFDLTHGSNPYSGLTLAADGSFLGSAFTSGANIFGTAFKITSGGVITVLHDFALVEGVNPYAPPIQGSDGNYYGTTSTGAAGFGSVYKITSAGGFSVLYAFDGPHGSTPIAPLIQATDGNFYGTTKVGGTFGFGTAFKITPTGALTVLYSFDSTHGSNVFSPLVQGSDGNFYGTTRDGGTKNNGGTIFKLTAAKKLTTLYSFNNTGSTPDGVQPYAGLIQASDGIFYGVTARGGTNGAGTLFKITLTGIYTKLYDFVTSTGSFPYATLRQHTNGKLYGEATSGGGLGHGALYSFDLGLAPFILVQPTSGIVSQPVSIMGQGLLGTTSVKFNLTSASANLLSDTYITTSVPAGATTGLVKVVIPGKTLSSGKFRVVPVVLNFSPPSGPVGTSVTITGNSFTGVTQVTFGGGKQAGYAVYSYTRITTTVPVGAVTGTIQVTTLGGTAISSTAFTVN